MGFSEFGGILGRLVYRAKSVPNRRYTDELRVEAARLATSVRHNEAARRLGVPVVAIGNLAPKQQRDGAASAAKTPAPTSRAKPGVSELEAEISRLRKALASAKLDVAIRSKAMAYFAKGAQ